jgi:hypothetical protein
MVHRQYGTLTSPGAKLITLRQFRPAPIARLFIQRDVNLHA